MADYSGFISSFNHLLPTGTGTDLMSSVVTVDTTSFGDGGVYYSGYMYIGDLLVQFSRVLYSIPEPFGGSTVQVIYLPWTGSQNTTITINYPTPFGAISGDTKGAYCVLANPVYVPNQTMNISTYNVLVNSSSTNNFTAQTVNGYGYIQYIAIGPR